MSHGMQSIGQSIGSANQAGDQVPITMVHGELIYQHENAPANNDYNLIAGEGAMYRYTQPTVAVNWNKKLDHKAAAQRRATQSQQAQPRATIPTQKTTQRLNPTSKCIVCSRDFTQVSLDFVPRNYLKHHNIPQEGNDRVISCFSCSH